VRLPHSPSAAALAIGRRDDITNVSVPPRSSGPMESKPLVLLIQPVNAVHDHTALLARAGFHVHASPDARISERDVLAVAPDLIAVELEAARSADTLDLARRLRADPRTLSIPVILYATQLQPEHIENAARAGILWLQIGSADGLKLVAAVRGVLTRSTAQADASTGSER
jgi:two-component system phosphate regulon response regulator PhoB